MPNQHPSRKKVTIYSNSLVIFWIHALRQVE